MATLSRHAVIQGAWSTVLHNASGHEKLIFDKMLQFVKDSNMPGISARLDDVSSGLFGAKRKFIIIKQSNLPDYTIYIGARDFGTHLDVSYFVAIEPSGLKRYMSKKMSGNPYVLSQRADMFSQQDLQACAFIIKEYLKQTLEEMCIDLKLNPGNLESKGRGYLDAW